MSSIIRLKLPFVQERSILQVASQSECRQKLHTLRCALRNWKLIGIEIKVLRFKKQHTVGGNIDIKGNSQVTDIKGSRNVHHYVLSGV